MATTMLTADGKRRACTLEEKARALQVVDYDDHTLAVISNSDSRVAYACEHDGKGHILTCACIHCKKYAPGPCAYRLAAAMKLRNDRRNAYTQMFGIYEQYG